MPKSSPGGSDGTSGGGGGGGGGGGSGALMAAIMAAAGVLGMLTSLAVQKLGGGESPAVDLAACATGGLQLLPVPQFHHGDPDETVTVISMHCCCLPFSSTLPPPPLHTLLLPAMSIENTVPPPAACRRPPGARAGPQRAGGRAAQCRARRTCRGLDAQVPHGHGPQARPCRRPAWCACSSDAAAARAAAELPLSLINEHAVHPA